LHYAQRKALAPSQSPTTMGSDVIQPYVEGYVTALAESNTFEAQCELWKRKRKLT